MDDKKLHNLLAVVVDNYISKGEPIGSKYLHSLEEVKYAPSTLRKYLHALEEAGLVYQPYNSSGRIPTVDGLAVYLDTYIKNTNNNPDDKITLEIDQARMSLKGIIDNIGKMVDGVVVGFLRNDEYYFLGINNLLMDKTSEEDMGTSRKIIDFVEQREIITFLSTKMIKNKQVYYTFIDKNEDVFSCLYAKVHVNNYDVLISILGHKRVNYKKNLSILKKLVELVG